MVTSVTEVEQVDWWAAAHSAAPHTQSKNCDDASGIGFATIPAVPKCSIQLSLMDYEALSLADNNDVPDIHLDVLANIPTWVVTAHAEQMSLSLELGGDISSLMLANDADADISETDSDEGSDNIETVAQLYSMDSALPTDHTRHTLRQLRYTLRHLNGDLTLSANADAVGPAVDSNFH